MHGSAPDIADKNLANPTALLLSGLMMLDHIGEHERAERIRTALSSVLAAGRVRTRDLGGTASTTEFTGCDLPGGGEVSRAQCSTWMPIAAECGVGFLSASEARWRRVRILLAGTLEIQDDVKDS